MKKEMPKGNNRITSLEMRTTIRTEQQHRYQTRALHKMILAASGGALAGELRHLRRPRVLPPNSNKNNSGSSNSGNSGNSNNTNSNNILIVVVVIVVLVIALIVTVMIVIIVIIVITITIIITILIIMIIIHIIGVSSSSSPTSATTSCTGRIHIYIYICIYIYTYTHRYNSLIADLSDKGSHGGQKKSNVESNAILQILSAVDSKGKSIGARKCLCDNVPTIVRNGCFVRPDHRCAVTTR